MSLMTPTQISSMTQLKKTIAKTMNYQTIIQHFSATGVNDP